MVEVIVLAIFLLIGYFSGTAVEKKHYKSIINREKLHNNLPVVSANWKEYSKGKNMEFTDSILVTGGTVVASDYFKTFVGGLRNLLGGRLKSYESLMDRARREARLRMIESAKNWGAKEIINVRLETTNINSASGQKNSMPNIEVLSYGTALK